MVNRTPIADDVEVVGWLSENSNTRVNSLGFGLNVLWGIAGQIELVSKFKQILEIVKWLNIGMVERLVI